MRDHLIKDNKGIAILIVVLIVTVVLLTITISTARLNLLSGVSSELAINSRDTYYMGESGIEDTLLIFLNDPSYAGGVTNTPIGTYTSQIVESGGDYTVHAGVNQNSIERNIRSDISVSYDIPPVTQQAGFATDSLYLFNGGTVKGNIWTNDNFRVDDGGKVMGNIYAGGKVNPFLNIIWNGTLYSGLNAHGGRTDFPTNVDPPGKVIDNPDTPEVEGNITAYDSVIVEGSGAYVQGNVISAGLVIKVLGGDIDGTITQFSQQEWTNIQTPVFNFSTYKLQAISEGRYYSNISTFTNYLNSLDNGVTRTLPDGVYYVGSSGGSTVVIDRGKPVHLKGTLITEKDLKIYSGFEGETLNGLPVLASKKQIYIQNKPSGGSYLTSGNVTINGIIFADTDVWLMRYFSNESITINGAVWTADDLWIEDHATVNYNVNPLLINGFNFGPGYTGGIVGIHLSRWYEEIN